MYQRRSNLSWQSCSGLAASRADVIGAVAEMNPPPNRATTSPPGPVGRHRRAPASGTARARRALAGLAKFGPLLLGSAKRRPRTRRRAVRLTISGLVAGSAIGAALGVAHVSGRLAKGRPGWLFLAVGFELLSALGFVATFQLVFGEWLPSRKSFAWVWRCAPPRSWLRPVGCSLLASEPKLSANG